MRAGPEAGLTRAAAGHAAPDLHPHHRESAGLKADVPAPARRRQRGRVSPPEQAVARPHRPPRSQVSPGRRHQTSAVLARRGAGTLLVDGSGSDKPPHVSTFLNWSSARRRTGQNQRLRVTLTHQSRPGRCTVSRSAGPWGAFALVAANGRHQLERHHADPRHRRPANSTLVMSRTPRATRNVARMPAPPTSGRIGAV